MVKGNIGSEKKVFNKISSTFICFTSTFFKKRHRCDIKLYLAPQPPIGIRLTQQVATLSSVYSTLEVIGVRM